MDLQKIASFFKQNSLYFIVSLGFLILADQLSSVSLLLLSLITLWVMANKLNS